MKLLVGIAHLSNSIAMKKKMNCLSYFLIAALGLTSCIANQPPVVEIRFTPSQQMPIKTATGTPIVRSTIALPTATQQILKVNPSEQLAFSANIPLHSGIYSFSPFSEEPKLITKLINGQTFFSSPSWSPDGEELAFTLEDAFGPKIYVLNIRANSMHLLTEDLAEQRDPTWSSDGEQIAFVSQSDLYVIKPDGSGLQRLVHNIKPLFPSWSPDSKEIAFLSFDGEDGKDFQIHIINRDGNDLQTPTTRIASFSRISWSPDGRSIILGVTDPCWDIASLNLLTGEITLLTNSPNLERDPSWSPDGKYIAYASASFSTCETIPFRNAINGPFDLYIMNNAGEQQARLTFFDEGASQPIWSPMVMLHANWKYSVTKAGSNLNVRESAATSANSLEKLKQGTVFTALEGPVEEDKYQWWKIQTEDGIQGWIVDVPGWYILENAP